MDTSAIVYWTWRTIRKVNTLFPLSQTCKVEKNKKERDYKLLQANYERLIELNKEQNDVKTKLWKIWLETHERKTQVTDKTSEHQEKDNGDNLRKKSKDTEKVSEQQEREQNISEP